MKSLTEICGMLRSHLPLLSKSFGVESLGIFGSYARSEPSPGSDLDLLVTFFRPIDLLKFVELEEQLSEVVGIPVDSVMRSALKPKIGERILADLVAV